MMDRKEPFCARMRCENLYIEEEGLQSFACRCRGVLYGYVDGCTDSLPSLCPKIKMEEGENNHE